MTTADASTTSADGAVKDVVVVGGGLAGLSAAWRMRHWDTVLLESDGRVVAGSARSGAAPIG